MDRARAPRPVGALLLAVAALSTVAGCSSSAATTSSARPGVTSGSPVGSPSSASPSSAAPRPAAPSQSPTPAPTRSPAPAKPAVLQEGSSGADVLDLQRRLTALGYWAGPLDGDFGGQTEQAVWALQKAAGLPATGTVNAATKTALANGVRPKARSTSGRLIEVDLSRGLLMFVNNGHVDYALNTSTGGGYVYYEAGERDVAITPKGKYQTYRVVDGVDHGPLGDLIRPRYFTGGFAIHGDDYVPSKPVSHGCVRVTEAAIDWIWANNLDPIGTTVYIY